MRTLLSLAAVFFATSHAAAGFIIGPGNVAGEWHDGASNLIAVDLNSPNAFGPGNFIASQFNYEFTQFVVGGGSNTILTGTITPILLTGSGTTFTPIAIGDTITYSAPTSGFVTATFGGSDSFTLSAATTVYGGLYWFTDPHPGFDTRMPIGFVNNTGNDYVVFGGGTGFGADAPVIGTPINGTGGGFFNRIYDFSIQVDENTPAVVPEPASLILALSGVGILIGVSRRRRGPART